MMETMKWIPLGSVVVLETTDQKILVIGRGLNVGDIGIEYYFDYCGVSYPDGIIGDRVLYFNHSSVQRVLFEGYDDDDNMIMNDKINAYLKEHPDLRRLNTKDVQGH